jgi:ACS family pantothenate transporter-like MFS transporter
MHEQVFVKTTEAPRFYRGYRAELVISIVMTAWIPVVELFDQRQKKKEAHEENMIEGEPNEIMSQVAASGMYVGDEKVASVKASRREI